MNALTRAQIVIPSASNFPRKINDALGITICARVTNRTRLNYSVAASLSKTAIAIFTRLTHTILRDSKKSN